ncbi:helix-turn-helix domain-containing protein [Nostoc sp. FACHB-87]|uniref:helix-turn-helix domain-containing protein n=1 Tax=Nostocaceae TaxID=1162 RepID=UPI0016844B42|nr:MULTISPECIES: helix-turn-helix domain-containing protein [Nostocaceae]MBD2457704.1 helix-turn-helix domain-containing protein [Nostoc sp. FACHB-87]MBD2478833.1 helix-turn-helix domain-containing protein [Anabaena sp. FACHB-83]
MGFRNGKPSKQFTAIPNNLIRDDNLTDSTFRLICWVASHDENFDISFTVIEKHLGYKRDKIRNAIKNAEQNDYLVRVQEHNPNNGKFDWQYYIFTSKDDTKLFRDNHSSIGRLPIGGSPVDGSSVGGSSIGGLSNDGSPTGGLPNGGLSNVGASTPHIEKQLEENQLEEKHPKKAPPSLGAPPTQECVCEETDSYLQPNQEKEPIPESLASLSNQSETSHHTDNPSFRPTTAAGSFEKGEQPNNKPSKPKFQSIEDLLNHILLDPSIMASEPLPAVYKNEIKLRCWRFPWRTNTRDKIYQTCDRRLVELIAKERAGWDKVDWQQKIPTVIKSISNWEVSKAGLEELLVYWSKVTESSTPTFEESQSNDQPIGYYSNRSLDWHKATFSELLDRMDEVGLENAIASFSTRYDQQHPGATEKWLEWLKLTHPSMYAYLHPNAA